MKRIKVRVFKQHEGSILEGELKRIIIPYDIDEIALKARLRDMGYITSRERDFFATKVYLQASEDELIPICTNECRTLEELGIEENTMLVISQNLNEAKIPFYD